MKARIEEWVRLGDTVTSCLLLDNAAKDAGDFVEVGGEPVVEKVIESLGLGRLKFLRDKFETKFSYSINDFFCTNNYGVSFFESDMPFFNNKIIKCNFKIETIKEIELPVIYSCKYQTTSFQFDSRSTSETKQRLGRNESLSFLKCHSRYAPVGVGGVDTKKELPYPYRLGDLESVAKAISESSQFVGVDSGMSHLAGVMGVPSSIFIMFRHERDVRATEKFYETFYPSTKCFSEFSEGGRRMPMLRIF